MTAPYQSEGQPGDTESFCHEALLYAGDEQFVAGTSAFIRNGLAADEPTLVVVAARKIDLLREELGSDGEGVYFADMTTIGSNPARIIPAWQTFVDRHTAANVRLRGIGEPIVPERHPDELVECQRHESLLNLAFADTKSFWLVCPYDTEALPTAVIDEAHRSHPLVARGGAHEHSADYRGLEAITAPFGATLPSAPRDASELRLDALTVESVPRFVADYAAQVGLSMNRRIDFAVAVSEIANNSLKSGCGPGLIRLWSEGRRIVCEIRDRSKLGDPLADRQLPSPDAAHNIGLWVANQLCDLVQVRPLHDETIVRLHLAAD